MDAKGIDKAVILPLNSPESPVEKQSHGEVLAMCNQFPGRFIAFCNLDPRLARRPQDAQVEDYLSILEAYKADGARGLGELTARLPWDHPLMLLLLEAAEQVRLPVLFHTITPDINSYGVIDHMGLPLLEKVLRRFPELQFIGHSGAFWSEIGGRVTGLQKNSYPTGPVQAGGRVPELMRSCPNLWCDISARSGLSALTRDPTHAASFIDEFQDRICLGLDQNQVDQDQFQLSWLEEQRAAGRIQPGVFEKLVWRNTDRLLGLGLA